MATVKIVEPKIVTVEFNQEKGDEDYGSCLWARFNFDLDHYSMFIESDCGSCSYEWCPTPDTESFLNLCSRFCEGYLIDKLFFRTVVDSDATYENIKGLIEDFTEYDFGKEQDWDMEEIENACRSSSIEQHVLDAIRSALHCTSLNDIIDDCSIYESIVMDFSIHAKKIEQIYFTHIVPAIKEMLNQEV